ncbi:unnamed protein product [Sphagnum jensenii]|uniref:Uncharacterized protein n=1 Tax=Sphagnum jensenii TaxID=128206 RepID=A0ABP1A0R8_9BRYO
MDGEIEAVGSRFTHEDYLLPCLLGYGDAVEKQWQCSKSSEGVAFVLIAFKTNLKFNFKTNLKCCLVSVLGGGGEWFKVNYSNVLVGRDMSEVEIGSAQSFAHSQMRLQEAFACVQKPYKYRPGSVSYRDYPANFSSARFVHFDGRRNFSSGNDFWGLACSEFSSYSEVWIADGAVL